MDFPITTSGATPPTSSEPMQASYSEVVPVELELEPLFPELSGIEPVEISTDMGGRSIQAVSVQQNVIATTSQDTASSDLPVSALVGGSLSLLEGDSRQQPLPSFESTFGFSLVSGAQVQENVIPTSSDSESDSESSDDEDSNSLGGQIKPPRGHSKDRPFQCQTCNQGFAQKSHLTRHERIHTGDWPFKRKSDSPSTSQPLAKRPKPAPSAAAGSEEQLAMMQQQAESSSSSHA